MPTKRDHSQLFVSYVLIMKSCSLSQIVSFTNVIFIAPPALNYIYDIFYCAGHITVYIKDFAIEIV